MYKGNSMANKTEELDIKQKKILKKSGDIEQTQSESVSDIETVVVGVDPIEPVVIPAPEPIILTKQQEKELLRTLVHPSRIKIKKVKIPNLRVIGKQSTKHFNSF